MNVNTRHTIATWTGVTAIAGVMLMGDGRPAPETGPGITVIPDDQYAASAERYTGRDDWPHWQIRDCRSVRDLVLARDAEPGSVQWGPNRSGAACKVIAGRWRCPYTGEILTDPSDVDHTVALGEAFASATDKRDEQGRPWTRERRRQYANDTTDPEHLRAVQDRANQAKGARPPPEWMPDIDPCDYLRARARIKRRYQLAYTDTELAYHCRVMVACAAIENELTPCPGDTP